MLWFIQSKGENNIATDVKWWIRSNTGNIFVMEHLGYGNAISKYKLLTVKREKQYKNLKYIYAIIYFVIIAFSDNNIFICHLMFIMCQYCA